ncbi:MAG: Hpt domain-containing protein [Proteobacteria bacterium]|nr:Hpt domain-containing protein [Pseudomonadota bacterium]
MNEEILTEFIEEARDHLQSANSHLLALENDFSRSDELNGLLRSLHSIKGNAGFLDLNDIYGLLHKAENILQTVREDNCAHCTPGLVDALFKVLDALETMIDQVERQGSDRIGGLDLLVHQLEQIETVLDRMNVEKASAEVEASLAADEPEEPVSVRPEPADDGTAEAGPAAPDHYEGFEGLLETLTQAAGKGPGDPALDRFFEMLDRVQVGMKSVAGPNTRLALEIMDDFMAEFQSRDGFADRAGWMLLEKLVRNLTAWMAVEESKAPGPILMKLAQDDLRGEGHALEARVAGLSGRGPISLIVDLRSIQVLRSREVGNLVAVLKKVPDRSRIGLVLDPGGQGGLIRVLKILGLDKVFQFFDDEVQAVTALN